ncbi:response regulator [Ancylobacter dichloromethanicus]|uniref:histidine kinase n=1 Tax=Ancylobacter dichloromethanicus TaxID=518825 RepID=A0A9W6JBA5_9HYPH|nr:MHYT domain-containing protein [Ancylobacter dichloromethanicus]MBS7553632.1 response regulator [Ancylobacter dichloromethanicus]GLK72695.1 sensor histidine kinase [Ancylobacter dichloromethanicus]
MNLVGSHDIALVALSILIAVAASFTALDLAGRIAGARGSIRLAWLAAAAVVLGGGIWSMHFIAMLALNIGMDVSYAPGLTLLSLLLAIGSTGVALFAAGRAAVGLDGILLSGIFMGLGIVGMHYTGMAAMRMPGEMTHDMIYVGAAIVLAVAASTVALWLAFRRHSLPQRLGAALALGFGIAGMHYVAMMGVTFTGHGDVHDAALAASADGIGNGALVAVVTAATFAIFVALLLAAAYDRRFAVLSEREARLWRESEERYRNLYRRTPLPLHSLGPDGRIAQVSDRWLSLLGYAREEVIGRPLTDFMTEESARRRIHEHWPRLLETGELREAEYTLLAKDGHALDCVLSAVAEKDSGGHLTMTLCGLVDVTERRAAEEALRQAQKLEAVGQLTGGIAHDFNNLLAVVMGNLELASKRAPDDPRLTLLLGNAQQAAQRGAALTQRMLAFARRQDLRPAPVDVPELVLGMADMMRRSIGPGVRIETRFPLGLPYARVDANQLELALLNLAVNARDAMPDGGVITIAAWEEIVALPEGEGLAEPGRLKPGHYFCLSVSDSGSGMDADTLARAAEPFFTTKGVGKGTGLGLAMVHGLAAQSDGKLVLKSEPGKGTTAIIYLPVAKAGRSVAVAVLAEDEDDVPGGEHGAQRVLVVDDDPLVLSATGAMLEDLGCAVTEASSAREALNLLEAGATFDVVLTDQAMPGMTGVQMAAVIDERWPDLPLILGTGYAELPADARAGMPRLGKPFSRETLRRAIVAATRVAPDNVVPMPRRG